ncbi:hypothetical protein JCM10295v2_005438 [Rhodotorula toruloides]
MPLPDGVLGVLAFQIVAPAAAMVAAVGKGWSDGVWFRLHWKTQNFVTVPAVTLAVVMAVLASSFDDRARVHDKHRITGFVLFGVLFVQLALGYYAHWRHQAVTSFAASSGLPPPSPKRRVANWLHMGVGIGTLTVGGLQVTWGFAEYREFVGKSVPEWLRVVHWVTDNRSLAGIPPMIITPYILVRGIKRLRSGHSFTESFFSTPPPSQPYQPPRKLFLGTSTYIDEAYAAGSETVFDADADVEKNGVGHEYAHGRGVDGRVQVESSWPGAATREEYEYEVQSSVGHGSVIGSTVGAELTYDDYRDRREEEDSLIQRAAPIARLPSPGADDDDARPTYPPSAAYDPPPPPAPPTLPPLPPVSSTFSPPPLLPSSVSPASGAILAFSPRLSFMPFAGPEAVNPPTLTLATSPTPALSSTEAVLRDQLDGEGPSAKAPTLVQAAEAASAAPQLTSDGVIFTVERRPSQVAKIEGEASGPDLKPELETQEEAVVEEDEDDDVLLADNSESTKLMDELERELGKEEEEKLAEAGADKDDELMLEREQSGKWFGSGRTAT